MNNRTVLFVSHPKKQCGVFEFGKNIYDAISASEKYNIVWLECNSLEQLHESIKQYGPIAIIYNYHPATMRWLATKLGPKLYKNNVRNVEVMQLGIIHEITQEIADSATAYRTEIILGGSQRLSSVLFDYYVAADPTLLLRNPFVYKTGRLIPAFENTSTMPEVTTIGSFGFGTPKKGFEKIVTKVQEEFDEAIIRLNIPAADFGDPQGENARAIAANCEALIRKKGIKLYVTHDFLDGQGILNFLARNSINVFLYEDSVVRGLSSAIDNALAVQRPIAVSNSSMFRHILRSAPSVSTQKNTLAHILSEGFEPLKAFLDQWNAANMKWEYERILDSALKKFSHKEQQQQHPGIAQRLQSQFRRVFSLPDKSFTWLRNTVTASEDKMEVDESISLQPIVLSKDDPLNRILDNRARILYSPVIDKLFKIVPKTMAKKIAEANVQQAFVFDTVCRFLPEYHQPKILCVGSYEDTASMSLIRMGLRVEEIDPMINYFLQEYITKPTTQLSSYNIILSTSVIEHDPNDESFVRCINDLLAPGGVAIITCDYKDGWKPGDAKPSVDERFYTQHDLKVRLLNSMPDCKLVDTPQWDCPEPDFHYLGKYVYTFATFVVKKNNN
ncbi:MAG: methyltransferase protein [Ferruginibacter sp.]|nr:methyltransferase protein [Ferruginibacter sp.]